MVIYEVNVEIAPETLTQYRLWLGPHIREILKFKGFKYADTWMDAAGAPDQWVALSVHYHCDTLANLEDYLQQHAPRLRAEATARFGNRFRARRRILTDGERIAP